MTLRIGTEHYECPLSAAMSIVGEWWTVLVLHDCFDGYTRFEEFQANTGISSSMLSTRLKRLTDHGILTRVPYQDRPQRHEYRLTELGRSLRPVLVAMAAWRNAQLDPDERSMILVDKETGTEVDPAVIDPVSGVAIDDERFQFSAGPAAGPEMRARYQ